MPRPSRPSLARSLGLLALTASLVGGSCRGHADPASVRAAGRAEEASPSPRPVTLTPIVAPRDVDPWQWALAVAEVEERRGGGTLDVPDELRHYDDRRRFLALQMAATREAQLELPHDLAHLAQMARRGEMVEIPRLDRDHILYEVGEDAREDPLAHYDVDEGRDVPLFATEEAYRAEEARLAAAAAGKGKAAEKARADRERLARHYGRPEVAARLFAEHQAVTGLASDFGGARYDLSDPRERGDFQARLLSFLRPEASDVLAALARSYRERFGRRLPVTSLVRTERYQRRLGRVNPNATDVEIPPHTTGVAFDISYKFMSPTEQNHVMREVADLEASGRVEALRERRNHIHVYVYADGRRPPETLVASFLDEVDEARGGRGR